MPSLTIMSSDSSIPSDSTSSSGSSVSNGTSSTDDNADSEVLIYITFHEDKKYSHPPDHPHSLNVIITSFLVSEPKIPEVLYVDHGLTHGVVAGRMVELLAQARPGSRRPDIKRFPYPKDSDREAIHRDELDPHLARIRRRLRHLASRYRCIMVIGLPSLGPAMADVRGWNIGEGCKSGPESLWVIIMLTQGYLVYERICFVEDCDSPMFELDGEAAPRESYGPDALIKY